MPPAAEEELEFLASGSIGDESSHMTTAPISISVNSSTTTSGTIGGWVTNQSKSPGALLSHLFFKGSAIFLYLFGGWLTSNFVFVFILVILALAADFYVVKNISGRLLVGLRWWTITRSSENSTNESENENESDWFFEALEDMSEISPIDQRAFWTTQYATIIMWLLLTFLALVRLKLEYLPLVGTAVLLTGANVYAYFRADSFAKNRAISRAQAQQRGNNGNHGMIPGMNYNGNEGGSMLGSLLDNNFVRGWLMNSLLAVSQPSNSSAPGSGSGESAQYSRLSAQV